ncbi:hypothetical protein C7445_1213 [Alicyclobacillus sacchari]|uniref:Uncharacterized protein n=1 Tax=Alicyclobacillus sacchari TaxID=392010 RepID=A0A4R8LBZ5_9BACL|nr:MULTISPECIES: hypothetical protein [Alicyclobacillus]TDY40453.1 hypothetical protein C7445_1213 [Alicyclobacillus sacchari]
MTKFMIVTFVIGVGASLGLLVLFNLVALATGKRTGAFVSFSTVTRLSFLFWLVTMVIDGWMRLGL